MSLTMRAKGEGNSPGFLPMVPGRVPRGSPQQEAIWGSLIADDCNLEVSARAGTGKSTTCREGMNRLLEANPGLAGRVSYVAFNRAIADEFQAGLPAGARATTMHKAGLNALKAAFPHLSEPNRQKLRGIADRLLPARDRISRKAKTASIRLAEHCKGGLIGADARSQRYGVDPGVLRRLACSFGVDLQGIEATVLGLVPELLKAAIRETASVDFGDMTWLPVMLELDFPPCDVLFVDEAQDLDPCQHALVMRMAGDGRMVVVGDPRQAIYSFRGADSRSMATLAGHLSSSRRGLESFPLTMTRRCPSSHVDLAARIVPDFEAIPGAPRGRWEEDVDPSDVIEPGWMVLCRKNAPLLGAAFRLVARNIPVAIQGREIGEGLARFVDDFDATTVSDLLRLVAAFRAAEYLRLSEVDDAEEEVELISDRCACVSAAAHGCGSPRDVSAKIRSLFLEVSARDQGRYVLLSSIHRAKGREAERVALLEPESIPSPWARSDLAIEQEENLAYVCATRSKHRLSFLGPIPTPLKG